jgi:hypothetical protein
MEVDDIVSYHDVVTAEKTFGAKFNIGLIAYALYLGETDTLTVSACVWQFPLIAVGMAALLVCAVSPRLCRVAIPGAAFIASIEEELIVES